MDLEYAVAGVILTYVLFHTPNPPAPPPLPGWDRKIGWNATYLTAPALLNECKLSLGNYMQLK